jgi:hypothetical protein
VRTFAAMSAFEWERGSLLCGCGGSLCMLGSRSVRSCRGCCVGGVEVPGMPLAAVVESLRVELATALAQGEGEQVRFRLGPVELEFQVQVSGEVGTEAGVKFWVVSVGGSASRTSASTHTIKLVLHPTGVDGGDVTISDEDAAEVG